MSKFWAQAPFLGSKLHWASPNQHPGSAPASSPQFISGVDGALTQLTALVWGGAGLLQRRHVGVRAQCAVLSSSWNTCRVHTGRTCSDLGTSEVPPRTTAGLFGRKIKRYLKGTFQDQGVVRKYLGPGPTEQSCIRDAELYIKQGLWKFNWKPQANPYSGAKNKRRHDTDENPVHNFITKRGHIRAACQ